MQRQSGIGGGIEVGEKVRFNEKYLRATKRMREPDAAKIFVIVECSCRLCGLGKHAALDERCWVSGGPRHAALGNLCRPGEKPRRKPASKVEPVLVAALEPETEIP